jgi:glycosyltransferase involved in cell wall biosynthesis
MKVWLIKLEEGVPMDENYRPYRMGMLEDALVERGHHVTRWCSDLNHLSGQYRFNKDTTIELDDNKSFEFLNSGVKYSKPVSVLRLLDNLLLAWKFKKHALTSEKPDLIVCAMPTPGLAKVSAEISQYFEIPLVIDARDYWPDIFENELIGLKKQLAKPIIFLMRKSLFKACAVASSFVGITPFYRQHLLNYAGRSVSDLDKVFPLGFDAKINSLTASEMLVANEFWLQNIGINLVKTERKVIYFAGRLNSTIFKSIDLVIDAAVKLNETGSTYLFVLCGSGQYEDAIKEKVEKLNNFILPGEVTALNLAYLRKKSFVAIQPVENRIDYINSLSNKFFEYIGSGLPVVTSLGGVTKDIIEENQCGFFYLTGDDLVIYLDNLSKNTKLRGLMSKNSLILFNKKFSSRVVYSSFARHCEEVVQKFSGNPV